MTPGREVAVRAGFLFTLPLLLLPASLCGADDLVSGPQVGATISGKFDAIALNGPDAGEECCLFCQYGNAPVVMVFAPKPSAELGKLTRALEAVAGAVDPAAEVGACVIVTDTSPAVRKQLAKLADDANLKRVVLAVVEPEKVKDYVLNPDAAATVLLYSKRVVRVNRAFRPGEMDEKAVAAVKAEARKHLGAK